MAYTVPPLALRLRRARAAHRQGDDGNPPRQAPPGLRGQRQRGARGHRPRRPADRGLLQDLGQRARRQARAVRNNGGGHYNHTLFWESMSPDGGGEPSGELADAINSAFGSFADFQAKIKEAGVNQFGSGWAWLVHDGSAWRSIGTRQPGQPDLGRQDAAARRRRVGARLLPEVPEPPPRLHRRMVERRRLGRGRRALRAAQPPAEGDMRPCAAP